VTATVGYHACQYSPGYQFISSNNGTLTLDYTNLERVGVACAQHHPHFVEVAGQLHILFAEVIEVVNLTSKDVPLVNADGVGVSLYVCAMEDFVNCSSFTNANNNIYRATVRP